MEATNSLEAEFSLANQSLQQVLELTQRYRSSLPPELVAGVTQVYANLNRSGQALRRNLEEHANLVALSDVSQVVNSSLELNEVLRIVMDRIISLTKAERGFLMLRDDQGEMVIRIARNWEQESIDAFESAISGSVVRRVVADGQPVLTTNAQEDPRFLNAQSIILHNLRSILCVPLKARGELTGVIYADNRFHAGTFKEADRNLLLAFANQAAIGLENARLFESVRRTLEEVTGLKNLMSNVFASIASGVITTNLEEQITLCNRSAQMILGELQAGLQGKSLSEVPPFQDPQVQSKLRQAVHRVHQTGQQLLGVELNPLLPERGEVNLSVNFSPLKDAADETQGVAIVMNDLTENRRLEGQRRLFERMVSPAVIHQLNPDQLQLGGTRSAITVLFADVRGFTRFSERLAPEELVLILNKHLALVADAILETEGTIDKFLGDAVMAWYNAPIPQPDHALRAVRSALLVRQKLQQLHASLPVDAQLSFGVGIHYGEAVLGLVGTEKRMEYTAIGDSVNTAKRIQENCLSNQILISASVYHLVQEQIEARPSQPLSVKGKSQPVEVYEALGLKGY